MFDVFLKGNVLSSGNGNELMSQGTGRLSIGYKFFDEEYLKTKLRERAVKGAGVSILSQSISYSIQFGGSIVLARILTPGDFGLVAMVSVVWLLLLNFGYNGFTEAIVQRKNLKSDEVNALFWLNLSISCGISLLFVLCSQFLAWFYGDYRVIRIAMVMAFPIICMALSTEHLALLRRGMMFGRIAVIDVTTAALSAAIGISLALSGYGYWALVVKQVAFFVFSAIGAWFLCSWRPGLPSFSAGIGGMVKYAMYTYGNYCVTYLSRNFDKILVGKYLGVQALGFYDRGYQFSSIFLNQLIVPLTSVAMSTLSRFSDERERFSLYVRFIVTMVAFVGMGLSLILILAGEDLVVFLLGSKWKLAGPILCAFGAGIGASFIYSTSGWIHLSLGRADRWLRWSILGFIGSTVACILGLQFGPLGVAIAQSLFVFLVVVPALSYAGMPVKLGFAFFIQCIWKYWISAVVAGLASWYMIHSLSYTSNFFKDLNILLRIILSSSLGLMTYLICIVAFHRSTEPVSQLLGLLRKMLNKS